MVRRLVIASVWFWGFWAFGSTLEFFDVAPSWPAIVAGLVGAVAVISWTGAGSLRERSRVAEASSDDAQPAPLG